jgi:hypothetical protein
MSDPFKDDVKTKHESFGVVQLSRVSGNHTLFGSSVDHHAFITLTICEAEHVRSSLHYDRITAGKELIQIAMSQVQLSEMLFNMNCGEGTPCTLQRVVVDGEYKSMEPPPPMTKQSAYQEEFAKKLKDLAGSMREVVAAAKALEAKATASKGERHELSHKAEMALQEFECNLPFIGKMFDEKVEKVVTEAKGEIEAYAGHVVQQTGLKALTEGHGMPSKGVLPDPNEAKYGKDGQRGGSWRDEQS